MSSLIDAVVCLAPDMVTSVRKRKTFRRVVFFLVLLSMTMLLLFQYANKSGNIFTETRQTATLHKSSKWLVLDEDSQDICSELKLRFPEWNILFTGATCSSVVDTCDYFPSDDRIPDRRRLALALKYAIENGARTIYVSESPLSEGIIPSRPVGTWREKRTLVYRKDKANQNIFYDPLLSWGCGSTRAETPTISTSYNICNDVKLGIETVVNVSPYLGTFDASTSTLCDSGSPSVVLDTGIYTTFPKKGVLFHEEAFWALPVLFALDVHLTMITQKLVWLSGCFVRVRTSPNVTSGHLPSNTFALDKYLAIYRCPEDDIYKCARQLITILHQKKILGESPKIIMIEWLLYLLQQRYRYPPIVSDNNVDCSTRELRQYLGHKLDRDDKLDNITNEDTLNIAYKTVCDKESAPHGKLLHPGKPVWDDVLLVITFNNNLYTNIPYLEMLYRKMFPHILYCFPTGTPAPDGDDALRNLDLALVFYHATPGGHLHGAFFHECAVLAAMMRYDVRGYFIIGDDVMIVPKQLQKYDKDKVWFVPFKNHFVANYETRHSTLIGWKINHPVEEYMPFAKYEEGTKAALAEIRNMSTKTARNCVRRLRNLTGTADRPLATFSDAWYIPANKIDAAAEILDVFVPKLFVEMAVPTMIHCITDPSEYIDLRSMYLSNNPVFRLDTGRMGQACCNNRDNIWQFIYPENIDLYDVVHPYKLSYVHTRVAKHVHFFCRYLQYSYNPDSDFDP